MQAQAGMDGRRLDLDWVRIGAFGLLILYHCGMFYVPWAWHVKSPQPQAWLQPVMVLTNPWRLPLLFLVSGAATRFMADRISPAALLGKRMGRLLPSLIFGMLVVVPPQTYLQVTHSLGQAMGVGEFYARYLTASGNWCDAQGACVITPTWNHLWFVAYLAVYSVLLCGVLAVAGRGVGRVQRWGEALFARPWALVLIPLAGAVFTRLVIAPRFPDTHALVGDWNVHAESALPFVFGYLFAQSAPVWSGLVRARWAALLLGAAGYAGYAAFQALHPTYQGITQPVGLLAATAYGVEQWAWIVAILGFAHRHLATAQDGPVRRYLTDAIFPFYIVHQTIIVVAAPWLVGFGLPQELEAAILVMITASGCFATYELVRRVTPLRPLFGLSLRPKSALSGSRRAAAGIGLGPAGQDAI
jgi:surface polysaccharide O-acyltransferase-like enzyme